jgi:aspartyl-tRNA(Asn)/glutamyl-tRNA(Gln) amidotransferase subunit C
VTVKIDENTVRGISALSRLEIAPGLSEGEERAELLKLTEEFGKIVGYMDILSEADTEGVEPLYSPMIEPQPPREDVPREVKPGEEEASEWILEDAPMTFGRFFAVHRIV